MTTQKSSTQVIASVTPPNPKSIDAKSRPRVFPWILGALGSVTSLGGCGLFPPNPSLDSPNALANVWSRELGRYNIHPVYPPREDIQIGDVYLLCLNDELTPAKKDCEPKSSSQQPTASSQQAPFPFWIERLPGVADALRKQEQNLSLVLPTLISENGPAGGTTTADAPEQAGKGILGQDGKILRLKPVSLPDFNTDKVNGASLDGLLPTGISILSLGMRYADISSARISIPQAGTIGLPIKDMLSLIQDRQKEKSGNPLPENQNKCKSENDNNNNSYSKLLDAHKKVCKKSGYADAAYFVVSEVFAAHQINFQVEASGSQQYGLGATIDLPKDSARQRIWEAYGSQAVAILGGAAPTPSDGNAKSGDGKKDAIPTTPPTASGDKSGADATNLVARTRALLDFIDQPTGLSKPGLRVQYLSAEGYGVSVERHYNHPVIIGVRGFYANDFDSTTLDNVVTKPAPSQSQPLFTTPAMPDK